MDRSFQHDPWDVDGDDRSIDHAHRPADHFQGHPHRSPLAAKQLLFVVDDLEFHDRDERSSRQPWPSRRYVRSSQDVQLRFRCLHIVFVALVDHMDERYRWSPLVGSDESVPRSWSVVSNRKLRCDPH